MKRLLHVFGMALALMLSVVPTEAWSLQLSLRCGGVLIGNVVVNANVDPAGNPRPGAISGSFTVAGGDISTLAIAAAKCGEDHFNWYQVVVALRPGLPGLNPPFVDPPAGGLGTQWADNLPGYYDETAPPPGIPDCPQPAGVKCHVPALDLKNNTTLTTLSFFDAPGTFFTDLTFKTFLMSANADGSIHALYDEFVWDWTNVAGVGPLVTSLRAPEPSTVALFLMSLAMLLCFRARRTAEAQRRPRLGM